MSLRILCRNADSLAMDFHRLRDLPDFLESLAQIVQRVNVIRLDGQCFLK